MDFRIKCKKVCCMHYVNFQNVFVDLKLENIDKLARMRVCSKVTSCFRFILIF